MDPQTITDIILIKNFTGLRCRREPDRYYKGWDGSNFVKYVLVQQNLLVKRFTGDWSFIPMIVAGISINNFGSDRIRCCQFHSDVNICFFELWGADSQAKVVDDFERSKTGHGYSGDN